MEKELLNEQQNDEQGASLVEYVLLVALIAVVCIAAISFLGTEASEKFDNVANTLDQTSGT